MESLVGSWLVNNGVSLVIVVLIVALYLSWKDRFRALSEIATKKDELLITCPDNRKETDRQIKTMREALTLLADRKMDSGKAYEEFVKHDHLNIISDKTEQTLEAIRAELSNIRADLRMIFERVLK